MVEARGLIDTGAILALFDANDPWHGACADAFRSMDLPLATTPAVLTEVFYFVLKRRRQMTATWQFIRSNAVTVCSVTDDDLPSLERLMTKYADRPMDFADATLVYLAECHNISTVLTTDRADFEIYRIGGRRKFRVLPAR